MESEDPRRKTIAPGQTTEDSVTYYTLQCEVWLDTGLDCWDLQATKGSSDYETDNKRQKTDDFSNDYW